MKPTIRTSRVAASCTTAGTRPWNLEKSIVVMVVGRAWRWRSNRVQSGPRNHGWAAGKKKRLAGMVGEACVSGGSVPFTVRAHLGRLHDGHGPDGARDRGAGRTGTRTPV